MVGPCLSLLYRDEIFLEKRLYLGHRRFEFDKKHVNSGFDDVVSAPALNCGLQILIPKLCSRQFS